MQLKFKWDMTKERWLDLKAAYKSQNIYGEDCYGRIYVGNLAIDIVFRLDDDKQYINLDVYAITDEDRGYGYTKVNKTPYDYFDSFLLSPRFDVGFDKFKADFECELTEILAVHKELLCYAEQPLGLWD